MSKQYTVVGVHADVVERGDFNELRDATFCTWVEADTAEEAAAAALVEATEPKGGDLEDVEILAVFEGKLEDETALFGYDEKCEVCGKRLRAHEIRANRKAAEGEKIEAWLCEEHLPTYSVWIEVERYDPQLDGQGRDPYANVDAGAFASTATFFSHSEAVDFAEKMHARNGKGTTTNDHDSQDAGRGRPGCEDGARGVRGVR